MVQSSQPERFGDALRRCRREARKTLRDLATVLDVSIVYVSDVERGNRKPLGNERILKVAQLLGVDPVPLLEAANRERGFIEYDITKASSLEADVVGGLVSGLARGGVSDDQLHEIHAILQRQADGSDN